MPAPNKASLYIYRNESFGAAIPMTVAVNGKALGQTAAPSALQAPAIDSVSQKLRELQNLRQDGVIREEDFQKKKQQLLEKL